MDNFLTFIESHAYGIFLLILLLFSVILAINWLARIFSWGTYRKRDFQDGNQSNLAYIVSRFFVNIIDDFKHLLALIIVVIFTALIIYSMTAGSDFDQKMEALQLVIASLGGLLGSIIGYYFGESAARTSAQKLVLEEEEEPDSSKIVAAPQLTFEDKD